MKLVAMFLVAVFVVAASTSFAFADCSAHNKAQLVKNQDQQQVTQDQQQVTQDQPTSTNTQITVAEKTAELENSTSKTPDKK